MPDRTQPPPGFVWVLASEGYGDLKDGTYVKPLLALYEAAAELVDGTGPDSDEAWLTPAEAWSAHDRMLALLTGSADA